MTEATVLLVQPAFSVRPVCWACDRGAFPTESKPIKHHIQAGNASWACPCSGRKRGYEIPERLSRLENEGEHGRARRVGISRRAYPRGAEECDDVVPAIQTSLRSAPHTVFAKSIARLFPIKRIFLFSSLRLHSLLRRTLLQRHDQRKVDFHSDYQVYVIGEGE